MYHYIRNYSKFFPFFNFLEAENFNKQVSLFKKKKFLNLQENFEDFLKSKNKILLSFDDGIKDHYVVYKKLLKLNLKAIFFIPSYPIIKKDFL